MVCARKVGRAKKIRAGHSLDMRVPGADAVIHVIVRHGSTWRDRQAAISPTNVLFATFIPVTGKSRCRQARRDMPGTALASRSR